MRHIGVWQQGRQERPSRFRLDRDHPLSQNLVFAGLGENAGGLTYTDSGDWKTPNHGTLTNFANPQGAWGRANGRATLTFDGSNDRIVNSSGLASFGTSPYSFACFINCTTALVDPNGGIYRSGASSFGGYGWWISSADNKLWGRHNGTSVIASGAGPVVRGAGRTHFCVTWNGTAVSVYINGKLFTSPYAISTSTDWSIFVVGHQNSEEYGGDIDDILCYTRALTPSEIQLLASPDPMYDGWIQDVVNRKYTLFTGAAASTKYWLWAGRKSRLIGSGLGV